MSSSNSVATFFTARLLGRLCVDRAINQLGVFVEDLPPVDPVELVRAIATQAGARGLEHVRVALLGGSSTRPKKSRMVEFTADPVVANRWRNDAIAKGGACLVVVVLGPAPKLNSLRTAMHPLSVQDLRHEIAQTARGWFDTPERREFWRALAKSKSDIPTALLLDYAASLEPLAPRKAALQEAEAGSVYRVGLLKSARLFSNSGDSGARKALRGNLRTVRALAQLADKKRVRLVTHVEDGAAPEHRRVAEAILRFSATGARADLKDLSLEAVREILALKPIPKDDDDAPGRVRPLQQERLEGDAIAVDLLLEGSGIKAAAQRFADAISPDHLGDIDAEVIKVKRRTVIPRPRDGTKQCTGLFGTLLDEETWGGVIVVPEAADLVSAIRMATAGDADMHRFQPAAEAHVRGMLAKGVDRGLLRQEMLEAFDRYAEARATVLPFQQSLLDHPLLALAGDPDLYDHVGALLRTYAEALRCVQEAAEQLQNSGSTEPARRLVAQMLALDVVFVRAREVWQAIAAPTHPFHLWRVHALVDVFGDHLDEAKALGASILREVVEDLHTVTPHIVLSPYAFAHVKLEHAVTLMNAGTFSALPLFTEPEARQGSRFRGSGVGTLAQRLIWLMTHAAMGLRVALIDPPSVPGVLDRLNSLVHPFEEEPVPVHALVLRTRAPQEETDEEEETLSKVAKDLVEAGGSLEMPPEPRSLKEVAEYLERNPVHLAVVFDPGDARKVPLGAVPRPTVSPLTVPRAYHYDAFDDRINVVVAGDLPLFSSYHTLFCRTIDVPAGDLLGRRSGASESDRQLELIARQAMWLTVVDYGIEPTFRISGAERLDWRQDAGRDVVTVTLRPETVEELIHDATRAAGLAPTEERVKSIMRELFDLSGEAILGLLRQNPPASLAKPLVAKGTIGVLCAVRWYLRLHPGALVISLDEPTSRRWILGVQDDQRQGDLLVIRSGEDGPIVEAIEVKAHDDPDGVVVFRGKTIEGRAVVQVDQTLAALKIILDPKNDSPVVRARRDVLKDQLYRAVAARMSDVSTRKQFVSMLEELFPRGPASLSGLIFTVKIAPGAVAQTPAAPVFYRSPAGSRIGHVDLVENGRDHEPTGPRPKRPPRSDGGSPSGSGGPPSDGGDEPPKASRERTKNPQPDKGAAKKRSRSNGAQRDVAAEVNPRGSTKRRPVRGKTNEPFRVLIGTSPTGVEVYWAPHDKEKPLNNFGLLITGDSGAGKTQLLSAVIHEVAAAGLPICAFDYKNDYAKEEFSHLVGLEVYDVNHRGLPFNPLELVPDVDGRAQPIRHIHELAAILRRGFGLGDQMEAQLRNAMAAAYNARGINPREWASLDELPEPPSFNEVHALLSHGTKHEKLLNRLSPLFDLELFPSSSDASTSFEELLRGQIVLLLNGLPNDEIKQAVSEFVIVRMHGHLLRGEQPRVLRRLLVFDEAWRVKDSVHLQSLAREGRAFGVGIAVGTQFPGDIPDTLTGNLATQVMLQNTEPDHRKSVIRTLLGTSTGTEARRLETNLQQLQPHEGYLRNQQHAPYIMVKTKPHYERLRR